ncbi:hypothetical protein [Salegentibacter chungangensis]|uniref:DUF3313 domain-containing protein n=1 Tax=Salegentibacter chungangensis TaxID=1335724 RepID=A0ABW3NQA0_9FLAO
MRKFKFTLAILSGILLSSCASSYQKIKPESLSYNSNHLENGVTMEYKYDLLEKKYAKKEDKKDIRLIAVKITNNGKEDLRFGSDMNIAYENGSKIVQMETKKVFSKLKQQPVYYLLYLLLTPMQVTSTSTTNSTVTSNSFPAGLIVGPGLAGGNLLGASMANKNFKKELMQYDITGKVIKPGETIYGLVGVRADNYDALRIQFEKKAEKEEQGNIVAQ